MMKADKLNTGHLGESIAGEYLSQKGYEIHEKNFRSRYAEIDIVAMDGDILVFVEVRTRIGDLFGTPEDSIGRIKINKLINNARGYVHRKNYNGPYRIDAVCIVLNPDNTPLRIDHYRNITL